jgi:hypothetical protein
MRWPGNETRCPLAGATPQPDESVSHIGAGCTRQAGGALDALVRAVVREAVENGRGDGPKEWDGGGLGNGGWSGGAIPSASIVGSDRSRGVKGNQRDTGAA